MPTENNLDIFIAVQPGLEHALCDEMQAAGFASPTVETGGVCTTGTWSEVWRANLVLRGAARVIVRIGAFRALHLAQLDKRARKFAWGDWLSSSIPIRVDATCRKSRIYHHRAAAQRIETALREELGATITLDADLRLMVRIEDNLCTLSIDTSGAPLHRRGHKEAVGKAPMRETMAALFLRICGYDGTEAVVDPMCGSGTFVLEAAEIAAGLPPGRNRAFSFQTLPSFDQDAWLQMKDRYTPASPPARYFGFDRDEGAIAMSEANAERAGVANFAAFRKQPITALHPPDTAPGLVIVNPPYGARIGNRKALFALYGSLGQTLQERFKGWRVGLITSDAGLARATALPFMKPDAPVAHGALRITLFRTAPLK